MMTETTGKARAARRRLSMAGITAGALLTLATAAVAGGCPAGKAGSNPLTDAATTPSGVTDSLLTSIDLSKEAVKVKDRLFRLRRLVIQPGGVVPMHSHGDRPALIYIVSGSINEYSSNCTVPIVHKAGEAAMESIGLAHWWKNTSKNAVVLISADLLPTKKEDGHMM